MRRGNEHSIEGGQRLVLRREAAARSMADRQMGGRGRAGRLLIAAHMHE